MFRRKNSAGFSLIEVLIATVVLCTIIPLTSYFVSSMKTNKKTELYQEANYITQKYMEEYKAKDIEDIIAEEFDDTTSVPGLRVNVKVEEEIVESITAKRFEIERSSPYALTIRDLGAGTSQSISYSDTSGPLQMTADLFYGVEKFAIADQTFNFEAGKKVILFFKNFGTNPISVDVENKLAPDLTTGIQPTVTIYNPNSFTINNVGGRLMIINASPDNKRYTITVTAFDSNGEELLKVSQNRMIRY
mgnify:CR=1 FL=1|jgi:prepilin-type N-terminal cleavage/methylation domain-containing protein